MVLYCSVDQAIAEPILAELKKATGIRVLARFDTEASKTVGLVQRLRAEKVRPVADVFWSGEVFYTVRLAGEGVFAPYRSAGTAEWPAAYRDPNGLWYGFALRARVIVYNTQRVRPEESPRSLEDLLEPGWQGRLVMANPQFGTTGGDIASWLVHYGRDRTAEILKGLASNKLRLVEGNSTVVRMVAQGQADVGLTDTDDVYAGQRNGWPVAMNPLDQAGEGPLAIPNTVAMIQGGPHPGQAQALIAFLLSEQVERLLAASDSHNSPVRPRLAEVFKAYAIRRSLNIRYDLIADGIPKALQMARETLISTGLRTSTSGFGRLAAGAGVTLWLVLMVLPLVVTLGDAVGWTGRASVPWTTWVSSCAIAAGVALAATALGFVPGRWLGTGGKAGDLLWVLLMISIVLPPYLLYYAWMVCLSPTTPLGQALAGSPNAVRIAGRVAAGGVLALWAWPLAALVQAGGWRRVDRSTWEAALLDEGGWGRVRYVTWPLLRRSVALALGLCFVLALSEVSTFDLGGIRTIGTELATLYPLTGSEAAVAYAAWPLVVVAVAVAFGLTRQFRAGPPGGGDGSPIERRSTNRERRMTIALLVLSLLVPVGLLVTALSDRYAVSQILPLHADDLAGSLSIAVATACLACVIAGGALAVRGWGRLGQGLSVLMQGTIWTAMLVPGSLVAVSILRLLAVCHIPDGIRNSWLVVSFGQAGRLTGVALILLLLADTGRVRVLSEMAAVDRASRAAAWWHVHLPLSWRMIAGAGLLVMMMSMTELATTMVLLPPGVPNFAQRLLNQMHYARDPQTLASCLALVATFAIVTTVVFGLVRTVRSFHTALAVVVLLGTGGFAGCGHRPEGEDRPDVVTYFGCTGKGQGQFMYPRAIEMAPDRTLFVIDKAGRVQHFTAQGGFLSEFQMHEIELGKPTGLAIGPDGDLYIADTHYSRVMVYSQGGQLKRQFGHFGQEDGCFIYPTDVAFGRDGRVFVSEYGGHDRVSVFDGQGRFQYSFGSPGHEKGQFSRPEALCVDPERDLLYVADACNHRIAVYTCEGRPVTTIGSLGIDKGQLRYPYGLTRLTNGNLVVCEYGNNRLQVFTPQGRSVAVYGGAGRQPGELAYPWAVAVDPSDRAYVVDSGNNRIQIWQL